MSDGFTLPSHFSNTDFGFKITGFTSNSVCFHLIFKAATAENLSHMYEFAKEISTFMIFMLNYLYSACTLIKISGTGSIWNLIFRKMSKEKSINCSSGVNISLFSSTKVLQSSYTLHLYIRKIFLMEFHWRKMIEGIVLHTVTIFVLLFSTEHFIQWNISRNLLIFLCHNLCLLIKEFQCVIELKNILLLTFSYVAGRVISFIWTYIFWIKRLYIHHTVETHGTKNFNQNKSLTLPCWHAIDHGSPTPWLRPTTGPWPIRNRAAEAASDCTHTQLHLHKRVCTCTQLQVCLPLVQMELRTCAQLLLKHNHSISLPPAVGMQSRKGWRSLPYTMLHLYEYIIWPLQELHILSCQ